jgi:hypothetical protein
MDRLEKLEIPEIDTEMATLRRLLLNLMAKELLGNDTDEPVRQLAVLRMTISYLETVLAHLAYVQSTDLIQR